MPLQFYAFDVLTLAGGSLQNQRLVACNVENDSGLSYRNEAGRPPPNLPLVRGGISGDTDFNVTAHWGKRGKRSEPRSCPNGRVGPSDARSLIGARDNKICKV